MRTGPASSSFANVAAVMAINGQRNKHNHADQQPSPHNAPVTSPSRPASALHEGAAVAPGQLLLAQLAGQARPAVAPSHRQGVAAYPSLPSSYQLISAATSLSRLHAPASHSSLFDFEI